MSVPSKILLKKSVFLFCTLFLLASCTKKMHFASSVVAPAAEGFVKYKKDNNDNYSVSLSIENLADPEKLVPPRETYVLWMQTENNGVKNLGQLNSKSGLFSSTLKASLDAVTPFKPENFFITAEDNSSISYPGQQIVLRTR